MPTPTKGMLRDRARGMRKQPSAAEHALWSMLRNRQLGAKFRRQFPIDRFIADFACVEAHLIIEVDGPLHEIEAQAAYDAERTARLSALGWRVLRLSDALILTAPADAAARITSALRVPPSP